MVNEELIVWVRMCGPIQQQQLQQLAQERIAALLHLLLDLQDCRIRHHA
jgi:hypothetical protein